MGKYTDVQYVQHSILENTFFPYIQGLFTLILIMSIYKLKAFSKREILLSTILTIIQYNFNTKYPSNINFLEIKNCLHEKFLGAKQSQNLKTT